MTGDTQINHAVLRRCLYKRVSVDMVSGCILWGGCVGVGGYGRIRHNGRGILTHRAAWLLAGRDIPEGMKLLHSCDTPACINVDHLSIGTQKQNMAESAARGRHRSISKPDSVRRGEQCNFSVLTDYDIKNILSLADFLLGTEISKIFGISRGLVSLILNRKVWKHVR